MSEALIQLFEGWGIAKVPEQIAYLSDFGELAFSVWETVYAPALATLFAYVIGLPLGIILVIGEQGALEIETSRDGSWTDDAGNIISAFENDQTLIRAINHVDTGLRHDESFAVATKVAVPV